MNSPCVSFFSLSLRHCRAHIFSTMGQQTEKALLKHTQVFQCSKRSGKRPRKGGNRLSKNVGLGSQTHRFLKSLGLRFKTRIESHKGDVSMEGCKIYGKCLGVKMARTIFVRWIYFHYNVKYQRFELRHKIIPVHVSPCFHVKKGDIVVAQQRGPLSKKVSFEVLIVDSSDCVTQESTGI